MAKPGFESLDKTGVYVVNIEIECPKRKGARVFSSEFFLFLFAFCNSLLFCYIAGNWDGRLYCSTLDTLVSGLKLRVVWRAWTL